MVLANQVRKILKLAYSMQNGMQYANERIKLFLKISTTVAKVSIFDSRKSDDEKQEIMLFFRLLFSKF